MIGTMNYNPADIVLVPFPFVDTKIQKKRPALVVSSSDFVKKTGNVVLLMITSAHNNPVFGDIQIQDIKKSGLLGASIVRGKIFSLDARLILKNIGKLSLKDQKKIKTLKNHVFFL